MSLLILIIISVSLSMDAFSLSLAYGTLNIDMKSIKTLSLIVGIYHFLMPLIGLFIGNKLLELIPIKPNFLTFLVLSIIGIEMIIDAIKKKQDIKILNLKEMLLFGFAVSLDSFSVGLGLKIIYDNYIIAALIFSIFSFIFTYLGLNSGKKINNYIGSISTLLGGIILIGIGLFYLF